MKNSGRALPRRILSFITLAVFIALVAPLFGQETTAGIQGVVKDPTGGVVAGATVEVASPALLGSRKVQTDSAGAYRLTALPSGDYTLTVTANGFRAYKQPAITLTAGRLPSIEVKLEVGGVTELVEVTSTAPVVDVTESKVAISVDKDILAVLPKGRSFQSVIPFAAGARQEPLQSTTSGRDGGFQIDGASDSENVYLIDGVNTTNIQTGGAGKSFQTDFIQEVQIKSSSFEAEFGGALGGVINAVPKRGSNEWHGELLSYFRTNSLNASDPCSSGYTSGAIGTIAGFSTVCGLRLNPTLPALSSANRLDGTPEYYVPKKDSRNIVEPGYQLGGPALKNKLWIFSSYVPQIDSLHRTTTFTNANAGPRNLAASYVQHNMYNRVDYAVTNSLRLFASWNYAYSRTTGQLGNPDSAFKQVNTGATTDPNTFRSDFGTVNPSSVWSFGGDWTPTSRLVISGRFGYFFNNNEQRGTPIGTRYVYQTTVNAASRDLAGNAFPAASLNTAGFANIPSNLATSYDAYKRKGFNLDASYFVSHLAGTHTFKTGFFWQSQSNGVLTNFQGGRVDLFWNTEYTPVTSTTACDGVKSANLARYGKSICQGNYGYFVVGTGVTNTGVDSQTAHAYYIQDAWNTGKGLTLNLGLRLDQEETPPYDPNRFPTVRFGWGDKIAPRIGGAYDLFHNGKVKVYASYGKFYDILKMGLARGSFGSDYWHNCVYAMDDASFSGITPTFPAGGGCPASGPAPGVTVGRFIENVDFRATKADNRDPAVQADMKPMSQHEFVTGVDWALTPNWSLESRYSRKRLDNTIEDMAITDNLGFYIGNPGSRYADVLHRPVVIPDAKGNDYLTTVPFCAECPAVVKPNRRYDGLEIRLAKRATGRYFGAISYTYSQLRGNYAGLTNSDPTDGGGGRHAPNTGRAFDIPTMTYLPNGKIDDGPLSTDRPHTGKIFGFVRQKWFGGETLFGLTQLAYQGTPMGTCLPVVGTGSSCQWAEGRGNFVNFTRASNGDFQVASIDYGARTPVLTQTDISVRHEFRPSSSHENQRLVFEVNMANLFNQHAPVSYVEGPTAAGVINPTRASRFSGDPQTDWGLLMNGYNYVDALNGKGVFAGKQAPATLANRYGLPQVFQQSRNVRLAIRFTF